MNGNNYLIDTNIAIYLLSGNQKIAELLHQNNIYLSFISELELQAFKKLKQSEFSCSTFMLYLGLNKKYDFDHHTIFFANDYKKNIADIFETNVLPQDPSFYIQNASVTDPSLAPAGKSTIYVLVPVPNLNANIEWNDKQKQAYRNVIIEQIAKRTPMHDIKQHIEVERIVSPQDWEQKITVYKGAVFNLAHTLGQMLYNRPHNQYNDIKNMYIVGGGTHPGSGLPTILESGRIAAQLISS